MSESVDCTALLAFQDALRELARSLFELHCMHPVVRHGVTLTDDTADEIHRLQSEADRAHVSLYDLSRKVLGDIVAPVSYNTAEEWMIELLNLVDEAQKLSQTLSLAAFCEMDMLKLVAEVHTQSGTLHPDIESISRDYSRIRPALLQAANHVSHVATVGATGRVMRGQQSSTDSAWVPANKLWPEKFSKYKDLTKFRQQHPDMFQHPSKFRLEIHAGLWASYWAARSTAGFEALGDETPSIADDPGVQDEVLAEAAQRMASLREKKRCGKQ